MNRYTRRQTLTIGGAAAFLVACGRKADTAQEVGTSASGTQAAAMINVELTMELASTGAL